MDTKDLNSPDYAIPPEMKGQIAVTSLDRIYNWGRSASVWPMMFGKIWHGDHAPFSTPK